MIIMNEEITKDPYDNNEGKITKEPYDNNELRNYKRPLR